MKILQKNVFLPKILINLFNIIDGMYTFEHFYDNFCFDIICSFTIINEKLNLHNKNDNYGT